MSDPGLRTRRAAPRPEQDVEARLLQVAYDRLPLSLLMTVVVTIIFVGLMWRYFPPALMTLWSVAILAGAAMRYLQWAAYKRAAPAPHALARWRRHYLAGAIVAGAAWSLGPTLMMPQAGSAALALFVGTLLSVCAVAMSTQTSQQAAMQAFIAAALAPAALAVWSTGGEVEQTLALVLMAGLTALIITGRRSHQATRALIETQFRLRTIIETEPECIKIVDAQGRLMHMNPAGLAMIEADSLEQVAGRPIVNTIVPEYRAAFDRLREQVLAGETMQMEYETIGLKGGRRWLETHAVPMEDNGDTVLLAVTRDITERKRTEVALKESEQLLKDSQSIAGLGSYVLDIAADSWKSSDELDRLFGIDKDYERTVAGWSALIHPDDREMMVEYFRDEVVGEGRAFDMIYRIIRHDDRAERWVHGLGRLNFDAQKRPLGMYGSIQDITERKQAGEALRVAATAFESQEGMTITDRAKVILRVNRAFTQITGYSAEEILGKTPSLLKSGRHDAAFYAAMWESIGRTGSWQGEIWNRRKNGEVYPEWLSISAVFDEHGQVSNYVASFSDITSRKAAAEEINSLAFYDPLTRMPNRRLLLDRLKQALASSTRNRRSGALLFIDLDNFKNLNDTLGHNIGDLMLQQAARRLATCIREGDTVARLGGDEFVVMLEDLGESSQEAAGKVEIVGEKILDTLSQTYQLASHAHRSTASIGITLFLDHQGTTDELLKRADLAMYRSKAAGGNTLRFFDPEMQAEVTTRAALEADLREALLQGQFLLHYQIQVVGEGRVTGVEALLRWQHPRRGMVSPAEFIPLAEETGVILPLGHWVLETACLQLAAWAARPETAQLSVAVNVSARQFHHRDFVDQVLAVLDHTGANPQRVKLELTESLLVDDVDDVIAKMTSLKATGVGFSLDDFGTGYSSLYYLKRLPLDQLKIDQGFVRNILTDANDAAIAKMVVVLAESLGLTVIAEGVETEAQRDFLARHGCHAYQGYLFSRPLPLEKLEELMRGV